MDLMEHKQQMVKMLLDMLQKSSGDEMGRDIHPTGLALAVEKKEPPAKMAMGGEVSPNVEEEAVQNGASPVIEQEHPEEEPEDVPAVASFRRRR